MAGFCDTITTNPKSKTLNTKQILMIQIPNSKRNNKYDLEERSLKFAKRVNDYVNKLPKTIPNIENGKQLVRAAGSTGANYIEANESLGKKDFQMRIKISKKEAKESGFWLELSQPLKENEKEKQDLIQESIELMKIFGSILEKSK
ncbi:MAG: four helix bundle protein [bacterium]